MNAKALLGQFREATFVGQVAGLRSTYYVLQTPTHYILITVSGPHRGISISSPGGP